MSARAAAHLIVGARDEPFLEALLVSLEGVVQTLIVNDNAPDPSPHATILEASAFARSGRLIVDRTPFSDFSTARNVCVRAHVEHDAGDWVAFVDADEVHGPQARTIAANLDRVPAGADFVDGYTWHFFATPDRYTSVERRMAFFRLCNGVGWEGRVHEHLHGLSGKRIALPYVYGHYGHVLSARRHAEKGRQYSSLGQSGDVVAAEKLDDIDVEEYFRDVWPRLLRFTGEHPPAARATIERLRTALSAQFADAERLTRRAQPFARRQRNALEKLNYELRWRGRAGTALARALMRAR